MTIDQLNTELHRLQWNMQSPRLQRFLLESSSRLKRQISSPQELPPKYLNYLIKLVHAYWECNQIMQILAIDWNDPMIKSQFQKFGYGNRMPLKGWEELVDGLNKRWFETGGGF